MATQSTIPLNHKYTLNVLKIDRISVGDTFTGVNPLRRTVIDNYNESNPSGGTKTLIDSVISQFLAYDKVNPSGNKIIITHKKQSQNVNLSIIQQTNRKKLIFKRHIDTLFNDFIITQPDEILIPTSAIIKELGIFKPFYYDYVKTRYDSKNSTPKEIKMLENLLIKYGFENDKDYITDRMEKLQEFIYTSFSKKNIEDIAKKNGITAVKLWQQGNDIIDKNFQLSWERNYIQPLKNKGTPPKYITKKANRQYMKDNRLSETNHDYIYSVWKFTKTDIDASKPKTASKINAIKQQLNHNFIQKLKRASVDYAGNNYHASNKAVLNDLINAILL
jgi:hypothetical protein